MQSIQITSGDDKSDSEIIMSQSPAIQSNRLILDTVSLTYSPARVKGSVKMLIPVAAPPRQPATSAD